ncbi:MAG: hypothetical protein Q9164_007112 [Protoblastenia rupestris]
MISREKYCAVCGCHFSLPDIRDPENPEPDENPLLAYSDPYDSRILPQELTQWLTDFRVVGRWAQIDPSFHNESSTSNFFLSGPAEWQYKMGAGEPAIHTTTGKAEKTWVYEATDEANGMLFPIHKACLDLIDQLCQLRQRVNPSMYNKKPSTLETFCDALQQQRWNNLHKPDKSPEEDYYYAKSGGIEWPHGYYGARQFWADEWDTEPGWELPESSSALVAQTPSNNEIARQLPWLFSKEIEIITEGIEQQDWEKGIKILREKASTMTANEGGMDEEKKKLADVPLGLKNRWRIWKILEDMECEEG